MEKEIKALLDLLLVQAKEIESLKYRVYMLESKSRPMK